MISVNILNKKICLKFEYSECPKTKLPEWKIGQKSVWNSNIWLSNVQRPFNYSGFQTLWKSNVSENQTFCLIFRHYENPMYLKSKYSVWISDRLMKLVWNIFEHQSVWNLDAMSNFQTHWIFLMYEKQTKCLVFRRPIWNCLVSLNSYLQHCHCMSEIQMKVS